MENQIADNIQLYHTISNKPSIVFYMAKKKTQGGRSFNVTIPYVLNTYLCSVFKI